MQKFEPVPAPSTVIEEVIAPTQCGKCTARILWPDVHGNLGCLTCGWSWCRPDTKVFFGQQFGLSGSTMNHYILPYDGRDAFYGHRGLPVTINKAMGGIISSRCPDCSAYVREELTSFRRDGAERRWTFKCAIRHGFYVSTDANGKLKKWWK